MATTLPNQGSKHYAEELQVQAFKLATPVILALKECDSELRETVLELFAQLDSGELDQEQTHATVALIAEILFPNADYRGMPGLDLDEAEKIARAMDPSAGPLLDEMDREETTFAERLRAAMAEKGMTQVELAAKVGIGQPAISMMLNRTSRPQRKTVQKIATALGVAPENLWPEKAK